MPGSGGTCRLGSAATCPHPLRSGRIAAVYGAAVSDGRQVVVKVHRRVADLAYLRAAAACQRRLAEAGYPCPEPLDGPATTATPTSTCAGSSA